MINLSQLRKSKAVELSKITEVFQRTKFRNEILNKELSRGKTLDIKYILDPNQRKIALEAGLTTFLLHCEARISSYLGLGYYTIGPCGEELLSAVALSLNSTDASALHYRHVSTAIARQLMAGKSIDDIVLDRARGFTCSTLDPVTGGKHCAIGGSEFDFIVTSTLASQAPPAVGRALGISLSNYMARNKLIEKSQLKFPSNAVSYVSLGDGSINNAHFLASLNLARYSQHRGNKCPVIFGISDNGRCISLPGYGWIRQFMKSYADIFQVSADGTNVSDVYSKSKIAIEYSRNTGKPSIILFQNLPRRFGHAATDRQSAYLDENEILAQAHANPLGSAFAEAIDLGIYTNTEVLQKFDHMVTKIENAFEIAVNEPKISSKEELIKSNSAALYISSNKKKNNESNNNFERQLISSKNSIKDKVNDNEKPEVMRKNMTRFYDELLTQQSDTVYIGEDVQHGGYYLVTDGLVKKFPGRVIDFPPDETTIIGAGMGFSQSGLLPIVEIPYAKYLDCAYDMFNEAIITNWLTNGKQKVGMIVRLQGFDKGVFGGNFHTHNMLAIPPGLDVVCYSNGLDYVRGMRYAVKQARNGRVIMSVDSTDLLNKRHINDSNKDDKWLFQYPKNEDNNELTFDDIIIYRSDNKEKDKINKKNKRSNIAIISYGNGVVTALASIEKIKEKIGNNYNITVIDSPYLSSVPLELRKLLKTEEFSHILFADVCKEGGNMPLGGIATKLHNENVLVSPWKIIGACPTYNPLSRTLTFLNVDDIVNEIIRLVK
jgi:2-oxoisovalerate dehydrogenase E1 component